MTDNAPNAPHVSRAALESELSYLEARAKTEPHNAERIKGRIHDVKAALKDHGPEPADDAEAAVDDHADAEHAVHRRARGR